MTVILAAPRLRALRAPRGSAGAPGGFPRTALRLQRRGLRPPRPRPGPGRLFTVTAGNNGAAGAATSMLAAVQDLRIIAASVTLRLLRPPAAAAPPVRSGREVARPVTNNMSTGICADAASRPRRPAGVKCSEPYHAPLRPSGVTWRAQPPFGTPSSSCSSAVRISQAL